MSYYNNNKNNNYSMQPSQGRGNYAQPYAHNHNNNFRNQPVKKHSGAKYTATSKNGNPCISAWNYSKRCGLISVFAAPYKGTKEVTSIKSRKTYQVWMCTLEGKGIVSTHFPVLVSVEKHSFQIENGYGWTINPNAPNGGYCGTFKK